MLLPLGSTQPKATWTPPLEETSAVAWFLSHTAALSTTEDVFLFVLISNICKFRKEESRRFFRLVLEEKEAEEHANTDEGQQMR